MSHAPNHAPNQAANDAAKLIRRSWRQLTGGGSGLDKDRPTLVACSGGADSSALAIALADSSAEISLGHIVHDLRPQEQSLRDRDAVRELAGLLGLSFFEEQVRVRDEPGNAEANARHARYEALSAIAHACGAAYIATGHHADDVLETLLMRLLRGAGPRGLGAIRPAMYLDHNVAVRPCLECSREELESICSARGWRWVEDQTNSDERRFRAALRSRVMPELRRLAPHGAKRAVVAAALQRDAAQLIEDRVGRLHPRVRGNAREWSRARLRRETGAVLGQLLASHVDPEVSPETIRKASSAIRDETTHPRSFDLGRRLLAVQAKTVRLEPKEMTPDPTSPVILVGHCGPDAWMLKSMLGRAAPEHPIEMINDAGDLEASLDTAAVLVVNRVLDGAFPSESGIGLIESIAQRDGRKPPMILVSNLSDAQEQGERAGALPGFGKNALYDDETIERVRAAIASGA